MKIVLVNDDFPPDSFGGAGIIAFRQAIALKEKGYQVFIFTSRTKKIREPGKPATGIRIFSYQGLTIHQVYSSYHPRWQAYLSLYNPKTVSYFKSFIKTVKPEIVHFHNIHYHLSYHCLKIAKRAKASVFITMHDVMSFSYGKLDNLIDENHPEIPKVFDYKLSWKTNLKKARLRYNPFRNYLIRYYLKSADKLLPVSTALKDALADNGISNLQVIHNGIDLEPFERVTEKQVQDFQKKFALTGKKVLFLGGRFGVAKGAKILLSVLPKVIEKFPDVILLIAAQRKGYVETFLKTVAALGLSKNVVLTGWLTQEEMQVAYKSITINLSPSICFDSFPNVTLEAYAARKPVIAACFGGTWEQILDKETGYIINPVDISGFANKILDLLSDPEKAKEFGEKGYHWVRDNYTLKHQYEKFIALYESHKAKVLSTKNNTN